MNSRRTFSGLPARIIAFAMLLAAAMASPMPALAQQAGQATPTTGWSCDMAVASTPEAAPGMHDDHGGMEMDFDLMYIDMMILHHGSIIALSEAALPHLTDPRLVDMATSILEAQAGEVEQLTEWREAWYGGADPMPMDDQMMTTMMEMMPGMGSAEEMRNQMDAQFQVSTFCAAEDPDLAFIQLVIPHHQMAVDSSEMAVEQATHPELAEFAAKVIEDQQAEIDLLNEILAEMDVSTPES